MNVLTNVLAILTDEPVSFSEIEHQLDGVNLNSLRRAMNKLQDTGRAVFEPGRGWRKP